MEMKAVNRGWSCGLSWGFELIFVLLKNMKMFIVSYWVQKSSHLETIDPFYFWHFLTSKSWKKTNLQLQPLTEKHFG